VDDVGVWFGRFEPAGTGAEDNASSTGTDSTAHSRGSSNRGKVEERDAIRSAFDIKEPDHEFTLEYLIGLLSEEEIKQVEQLAQTEILAKHSDLDLHWNVRFLPKNKVDEKKVYQPMTQSVLKAVLDVLSRIRWDDLWRNGHAAADAAKVAFPGLEKPESAVCDGCLGRLIVEDKKAQEVYRTTKNGDLIVRTGNLQLKQRTTGETVWGRCCRQHLGQCFSRVKLPGGSPVLLMFSCQYLVQFGRCTVAPSSKPCVSMTKPILVEWEHKDLPTDDVRYGDYLMPFWVKQDCWERLLKCVAGMVKLVLNYHEQDQGQGVGVGAGAAAAGGSAPAGSEPSGSGGPGACSDKENQDSGAGHGGSKPPTDSHSSRQHYLSETALRAQGHAHKRTHILSCLKGGEIFRKALKAQCNAQDTVCWDG
jgi:hypothetical protein